MATSPHSVPSHCLQQVRVYMFRKLAILLIQLYTVGLTNIAITKLTIVKGSQCYYSTPRSAYAQGLNDSGLYCTPSLHLTLQQRIVSFIRSVCQYTFIQSAGQLIMLTIDQGYSIVTALHNVPMLKDLLLMAYIALPHYISHYSRGSSVLYAQ